MKLYGDILYKLFLLFFISISLFGQGKLSKTAEHDALVFLNDNLRIELHPGSYKIFNGGAEIFSAAAAGKKIFASSEDNSFFFIANFPFTSEKTEYKISVDVFDSRGDKKFSYSVNSFFDLPHPLFEINNSGLLSVYDPLSYRLVLADESGEREITLVKDAVHEMERGAFLASTDEHVFVMTSHEPLSIEETKPNVSLYKIDISALFVNEYKLNYSTATLLKIKDESLYISGIQFENSVPKYGLVKYDLNMKQAAFIQEASEALIFKGDKAFSKFGNTIYRLNKSLALEKAYHLDNKWIKDIALFNNSIVALSVSGGSQYLIGLNDDLVFDFEMILDIFTPGNFSGIQSSGENLLLRFDKTTLIFN